MIRPLSRARSEGMLPVPSVLPLLPVRDVVLFPGTEERLRIGRPASQRLLAAVLPAERLIGVFAQKYDRTDRPLPDDLCRMGVAVEIEDVTRLAGDRFEITVRPYARIRVKRVLAVEPFLRAAVEVCPSIGPIRTERHWQATVAELRDIADKLGLPGDEQPLNPGRLADAVAADLEVTVAARQDLLEELDDARRVRAVLLHASDQLEIMRLRKKIRRDVTQSFSSSRRRAYLHEQLRVIRGELGEGSEGDQITATLRRRLEHAGLPSAAMVRADRELKRLAVLRPASAEYPLAVDYLELLAELPWGKMTSRQTDLAEVRTALDVDHYDLEMVKRRIIEHIAVRWRNPGGDFPVLCLLGPPGVGKHSLARAMAASLGRQFAAMPLSGVQTEADLVGGRRTRPDAMPGRPMLELRRLGVRDPLLLLAEVDRLPAAVQGDPVHALLELIDPRRNRAFVDRFLDVAFDLSPVLFVATAQYADDIPGALRERLEIVRLPGYSDDDKRRIARKHLVPRQIAEHGLTAEQCHFEDAALDLIIADYTREAGVRGLERRLGALCRAVVPRLEPAGAEKAVAVTPAFVEEIFGAPRFLREARLTAANTGVVTGLAWTNVGGEIMHIEALRFPGKGNIQLTGQIGSVMKESAQAALSLLKSRAAKLGLNLDELLDSDIHVHVPAGAVPKDGPSAGAAIFTAMVSLWTGQKVRADVAMTGELTLRGLILPIGGLKEKILAAQRAGIPTVILPRLNEKDLAEVPVAVRDAMELILVNTADEVLAAALDPVEAAPKQRRKRRE
jgi:ATP-dependent Lon protease